MSEQSDPFDRDELKIIDVTAGLEAMRAYDDDSVSPWATGFSVFLAERLDEAPLIPAKFVNHVVFAVYDLQRGKDDRAGHSGQEINNPMAKLKDAEYRRLFLAAPRIARAAFGQKFGEAVESTMVQRGVFYPEAPYYIPEKEELIENEISEVEEAYGTIVLEAWRRADEAVEDSAIGPDQIELAKVASIIALRNGPYALPLTILTNTEEPLSQTIRISEDLSLAMEAPIDPGMATFVRDFIYLHAYGQMIGRHAVSQAAMAYPSAHQEATLATRASCRSVNYIRSHPEIIKEPLTGEQLSKFLDLGIF